MVEMTEEKQQELFLNTLFQSPQHEIELRIISKDGIVVGQHFSRDHKKIKQTIKRYSLTKNIYFGVFTREGNQGKAENVREGTCVFADMDFKDYKGGQAEADEIIKKFPVKPSLIIHSGNGYHLYWLLSEVINIQDLKNKIINILRGIANCLMADTSVADIARVLRMPGTLNQKSDPPKPVNIIHINDARYSLDDFKEYETSRPENRTPLKELYQGVPDGSRNDSLARVIGSLVNDGLSFDECLNFAYQWNERNNPPETNLRKIKRTVQSIFEKHYRGKDKNNSGLKGVYSTPIDISQFKPITLDDLKRVLGLTIKRDDDNKLITFCAMVSAFTEDSQLNVSFNAPSSTGKSYIPSETAQLFPLEDVIQVGYCSPTAFFHDIGQFNKEKNGYTVDLERKIIIFLDQPHSLLLQHLRPVLSHDKKEIQLKITDKTKRAGLRTRNIFIKGFPSVIFCTAWLKIDEQEATRFFLLSPDTKSEKVRAGIKEKIKRESDKTKYNAFLDNHPERQLLKERIRTIKAENISDIKILNTQKVEDMFFEKVKVLKSRHQRDIGYIISLIKVMALLNLWFRDRDGSTVIANDQDIEDAFEIWGKIFKSQEYGLPPYIFDIYHEVILSHWHETKQEPLSRRDIIQKHYSIYGRLLADWLLRKEIIPILENVGLIIQEPDKDDKRKMLIIPTESEEVHPMQSTIFDSKKIAGEIVDSMGGTLPDNSKKILTTLEVCE